eukprot:gene8350-12874_t
MDVIGRLVPGSGTSVITSSAVRLKLYTHRRHLEHHPPPFPQHPNSKNTKVIKMVGTGMTREKLEKMAEISRVGGVRRKHKAPRKTLSSDDSKLQNGLKKLGVSQIPDIEEVNFIMENGTILHFGSPK